MTPTPGRQGRGAAGHDLVPIRALAVLPARLASTRLPRKVLLAETGLPLFVHAARNAARCAALTEVLVATDSNEVLGAADSHRLAAVLTKDSHVSGTDRVREALALYTSQHGEKWDVVVNVQADEPEVDPGDLASLVAAFEDPDVQIATLCVPCTDAGELASSSAVKLVRDAAGDALYFSRSPIPNTAHAREGAEPRFLRHLGVYAFRPAALERCCDLPQGRLEAAENLEQLRWLEAGFSIRVLDARRAPRGIDTRADYDAFVAHHQSLSSPASPPR